MRVRAALEVAVYGVNSARMKLHRPTAPTIVLITVVYFAVAASVWGPRRHRSPPAAPAVPTDSRDNSVSRPLAPGSDLDVESTATAGSLGGSFDFYLLTLSWHPAFCADGHMGKAECRAPPPHPLTIHGLWPENLAAGAYPHDCAAARLDLDPGLASDLSQYMPGMQSHLHEHEWRTHGACSGLGDDEYFRYALDLARTLDAALAPRLTTLAGRETSPEELRAAADAYRPGLGKTFTLQCRTLRAAPPAAGGRPFLIEVRQCIDNDGPHGAPGTLLECAAVSRRDQGCGRAFRIAHLSR
jgi:ribonuclease T2